MPSQMATTNITLRCQNNLAMPDKVWSCSARPFLVLSGCCQTVACCQGAVKNFRNDDACTTKNHRELGALGYFSERQDANNLWDGAVTGLGLRCLAGGTKTWVFVYRAPDEALDIFRRMHALDEQCTCLEPDWDGKYWEHRRCEACEQWHAEHVRLHDLLKLKPNQWPAIENPDTESVPGNSKVFPVK